MNNEIKEIFDYLKNKDNDIKGINSLKYQDLTRGQINLLLDYITNLQQENEELKKKLDRRYYKNEYERIQQENERLKDIVVEKDNQIKEMILQKTDYTAVNILEMKLEDYKSRCEKAIEYVKNNSLYTEDYDYDEEENLRWLGAYDYKESEDLLNILQNGSEEK